MEGDNTKKVVVRDKDSKTLLLNDAVFYEILFALGVSEHNPSDYCVWEHLNFSRMGHARALIYFFECSSKARKWLDDLVSEDFGFGASSIGLSQEDRERLNKDLFHLSVARARHNSNSKAWPHTILNRVHTRSVEFNRHLLSPAAVSEYNVSEPRWRALLRILESGQELSLSRSFDIHGKDSGWQLAAGRKLTTGASELTQVLATRANYPNQK